MRSEGRGCKSDTTAPLLYITIAAVPLREEGSG